MYGAVYGMADEPVSKSGAGNSVWVRVPPAPLLLRMERAAVAPGEIRVRRCGSVAPSAVNQISEDVITTSSLLFPLCGPV